MTAREFAVTFRPQADEVSAGSGILPLVLLAQWGLETGWGNHINNRNNLGNIRDKPGSFAQLPTLAAFCQLAIATWHNGYYAGVLGVAGAAAQIAAIGRSPWDAGHYDNGGGPGSALLAYFKEIFMFPIQMRRALIGGWWRSLFGTDPDEPTLENWAGNLRDDGSNWDTIYAQLATSQTAVDYLAKLHTLPPGATFAITGTIKAA